MTAGSIELFPMRVAPMSAPPPATASLPVNPSLEATQHFLISKQRVCRNLFGSVEPGSTEVERRNEEQTKVAEWQRRYNVDLNAMKIGSVSRENKINVVQQQQQQKQEQKQQQLPNLIEQEQREYEKRLALRKQTDLDENDEEKCNSTIEKIRENAETTPQPTKTKSTLSSSSSSVQQHLITSGSKHRNHCNETHCLVTQNGNSPRRLPYARQKLISECFATRRKPSNQQSLIERQKLWLDSRDESSESDTFLLNISSSTTESKMPSNKQQLKKT